MGMPTSRLVQCPTCTAVHRYPMFRSYFPSFYFRDRKQDKSVKYLLCQMLVSVPNKDKIG